MRRSLKAQLPLTIVTVVFVTVVLISVLSNVLINRQFENYITRQNQVRVADIADNLSHQYDEETQAWDQEVVHAIGMFALYDGYIIIVYDKDGAAVWDAHNHDMTLCLQIMDDITERMAKLRPGSPGGFELQEYPLSHNGREIGSMAVSYFGPYFLSEYDFQFLSALNTILLVIGAASLAFSFVTGWLLARRIARPITKTAQIAKQISRGNYDIRFESNTKTRELDDLVLAINHLADVLSKQENLRKQLTADVAHELRTPLAAVGSHLEAMIEGVWEPTAERLKSCQEEIRRLTSLVADLERLAKVESDNLKLSKSQVDLMELAHSVSGHFELEMERKDLKLVIEGEPAVVYADRDRISQVLLNLISNAVKYTRPGGNIRIATEDAQQSGILTVEDDGVGIPKGEIPLIFEQFYRADKSRNRKTGGAGIGLAIVKSIVQAHGGTVKAESREGRGTRFTVTLPK
ncbi:MAG: ATP-binding protein [Christensenellales bacterium]|jgi:two-component system sensor histidine kinase BaeS